MDINGKLFIRHASDYDKKYEAEIEAARLARLGYEYCIIKHNHEQLWDLWKYRETKHIGYTKEQLKGKYFDCI